MENTDQQVYQVMLNGGNDSTDKLALPGLTIPATDLIEHLKNL